MAATVSLCSVPTLQFLDNRGVPAAGGTVLTQVGGVNYPTYQDSGGTTALPNPIPLNARGEISNATGATCQLFLVTGQIYTFTVFDANSNQLDSFAYMVANATSAGPCNSYGNEDSWTDVPYAPGVLLIGDAAGHNDPIIGQGLSITYRDVRIVSELLKSSDDWVSLSFASYGEERRERMRRRCRAPSSPTGRARSSWWRLPIGTCRFSPWTGRSSVSPAVRKTGISSSWRKWSLACAACPSSRSRGL